jgi:hypothetical protein
MKQFFNQSLLEDGAQYKTKSFKTPAASHLRRVHSRLKAAPAGQCHPQPKRCAAWHGAECSNVMFVCAISQPGTMLV